MSLTRVYIYNIRQDLKRKDIVFCVCLEVYLCANSNDGGRFAKKLDQRRHELTIINYIVIVFAEYVSF